MKAVSTMARMTPCRGPAAPIGKARTSAFPLSSGSSSPPEFCVRTLVHPARRPPRGRFRTGPTRTAKGPGRAAHYLRPADALPLLAEIRDERKEHFLCLCLNARNQVIHKEVISIGSLSASIVHPREVFQVAIAHTSASIILAHNHPSGDATPRREDIDLTRRLVEADES